MREALRVIPRDHQHEQTRDRLPDVKWDKLRGQMRDLLRWPERGYMLVSTRAHGRD